MLGHVKILTHPVSNIRSCDPNVHITYIYPPKLRAGADLGFSERGLITVVDL